MGGGRRNLLVTSPQIPGRAPIQKTLYLFNLTLSGVELNKMHFPPPLPTYKKRKEKKNTIYYVRFSNPAADSFIVFSTVEIDYTKYQVNRSTTGIDIIQYLSCSQSSARVCEDCKPTNTVSLSFSPLSFAICSRSTPLWQKPKKVLLLILVIIVVVMVVVILYKKGFI